MLLDAINDLENHEARLHKLTANILLQSGSIFRIVQHVLENWGIRLTNQNRDFIKARSEASFEEEWEQDAEIINIAINRASAMAGLGEGNTTLNSIVARMVHDLLCEYVKVKPGNEPIYILDIGAGAGETSSAVVRSLETSTDSRVNAIFDRYRFHLLEPTEAIYEASRSLGVKRRTGPYAKSKIATFVQADDSFLESYRDGMFDLIISNAALHHKAFPDYLKEVRRVLKDDGAFVLGDWYTSIWYHPAYILPLFKALGADRDQIYSFMDVFGLSIEQCRRLNKQRSPEEMKAQVKMIVFLRFLGQIINQINEKREAEAERTGEPRPLRLKCCFLEAHETLNDRCKALQEKGFETSLPTLKKANRVFRAIPKSPEDCLPKLPGFACVMAVGKKR